MLSLSTYIGLLVEFTIAWLVARLLSSFMGTDPQSAFLFILMGMLYAKVEHIRQGNYSDDPRNRKKDSE